MAENNENRRLRSMSDAVDELTRGNPNREARPAEEDERPRRARDEAADISDRPAEKRRRTRAEADETIDSVEEAVESIRVYGEGGRHRTDESMKAPVRRKKRRKKKKKKKTILDRIMGSRQIRKEKDKPLTIFGFRLSFWPMFILAFVVIMLTAMLMNGSNLISTQQSVTIMGVPSDLEGFKMLVLSDLNGRRFGDKQVSLLRQIDSLDYDIVVCLGDMVGEDGDPEPFYELLEGLPSRRQVYFICGDSDPGPYAPAVRGENAPLEELVLADWILGAIDRGAIYVDRPTLVTSGDARVWFSPTDMLNIEAAANLNMWKDQVAQEESGYLAGIVADADSLPFTTYRRERAQALLDSINSIQEDDLHISLTHVPAQDNFIAAADVQAKEGEKYLPTPDIALAGHYCGGVWNLPILGAFYVPDSTLDRYGWFPPQDVAGGLRQIEETQLFTSRGLSTCGDTPVMAFRLMNNPEVTVLTITATLPSSMLD